MLLKEISVIEGKVLTPSGAPLDASTEVPISQEDQAMIEALGRDIDATN